MRPQWNAVLDGPTEAFNRPDDAVGRRAGGHRSPEALAVARRPGLDVEVAVRRLAAGGRGASLFVE